MLIDTAVYLNEIDMFLIHVPMHIFSGEILKALTLSYCSTVCRQVFTFLWQSLGRIDASLQSNYQD